jgi:hypothetical protein
VTSWLGPAGSAPVDAALWLEVVDAPRGQRVGHHGHDLSPTTTEAHRRRSEAVLARAHADRREAASG